MRNIDSIFNDCDRREFIKKGSRVLGGAILSSLIPSYVNAKKKKNVLLMSSTAPEMVVSQIKRRYGEKDLIKRLKEDYLSEPLTEFADSSDKVFLEGMNPKDYNLSVKTFNSKESFFDILINGKTLYLDEIIIDCHGMPLYLEFGDTGNLYLSKDNRNLEDITYQELCDDYFYGKLFSMGKKINIKDNIISIEDLRNLNKNQVNKIRARFEKNAKAQLRSCLSFYNLGRKYEKYPVFGVEFAKLLNVPVIGSVPEFKTISLEYISGNKTLYRSYSNDWVRAIPKNKEIIIEDLKPKSRQ